MNEWTIICLWNVFDIQFQFIFRSCKSSQNTSKEEIIAADESIKISNKPPKIFPDE